MSWGEWLLATGAGAVLLAVVQAVINRRKMGADTASVLTRAAAELVGPLTERMHELENEVDVLRRKVREAARELEECHLTIRARNERIRQLEGTS